MRFIAMFVTAVCVLFLIDTCYVIAMAILLASVSFWEKPNIPICNLLKWDKGSGSEHTWFPYCLNSSHEIVGDGYCLFKIKSGNFSLNYNRTSSITVVVALAQWMSFCFFCDVHFPTSLKNTDLIFLEIFLIECSTVFVEPPVMSSCSSFA